MSAIAEPAAVSVAIDAPPTSPPALSRRRFLKRALIGGLGATAGAAAYARWWAPFQLEITQHEMPLPNLGADLCGKRLAHITDLHVSDIVPLSYLRDSLAACRARKPDILVFTGDYVTNASRRYLADLDRLFEGVAAPLGVYASLGNHDYHEGCNHRFGCDGGNGEVAELITELLTRRGVRVLRNGLAVVRVGAARLQFAGAEDLWSGYYDPDATFAGVDPSLPCIALSHNPDTIDELRDKPCHWILSGHTHGGQVSLPLIGPPILPVAHRELASGLHRVNGRNIYVSRGVGYVRPVRFMCPPEIAEFTLTRAAGA